jgi:hypothetical protein
MGRVFRLAAENANGLQVIVTFEHKDAIALTKSILLKGSDRTPQHALRLALIPGSGASETSERTKLRDVFVQQV